LSNELGIYDMSGNVLEWCSDGKREYKLEKQTDPIGFDGLNRVLRGGGWADSTVDCRVSRRGSFSLSNGSSYLGFRLAIVYSGQDKQAADIKEIGNIMSEKKSDSSTISPDPF
jgi:formylglycine-generating enzyme required for sulfatase activity